MLIVGWTCGPITSRRSLLYPLSSHQFGGPIHIVGILPILLRMENYHLSQVLRQPLRRIRTSGLFLRDSKNRWGKERYAYQLLRRCRTDPYAEWEVRRTIRIVKDNKRTFPEKPEASFLCKRQILRLPLNLTPLLWAAWFPAFLGTLLCPGHQLI